MMRERRPAITIDRQNLSGSGLKLVRVTFTGIILSIRLMQSRKLKQPVDEWSRAARLRFITCACLYTIVIQYYYIQRSILNFYSA